MDGGGEAGEGGGEILGQAADGEVRVERRVTGEYGGGVGEDAGEAWQGRRVAMDWW